MDGHRIPHGPKRNDAELWARVRGKELPSPLRLELSRCSWRPSLFPGDEASSKGREKLTSGRNISDESVLARDPSLLPASLWGLASQLKPPSCSNCFEFLPLTMKMSPRQSNKKMCYPSWKDCSLALGKSLPPKDGFMWRNSWKNAIAVPFRIKNSTTSHCQPVGQLQHSA